MPARATTALPLPTSDLRSNSREARRDRAQKAKWSHGGRPGSGKNCPHSNFENCNCHARPVLSALNGHNHWSRREKDHNSGKLVKNDKLAMRAELTDDVSYTNSDSSAGEEVKDVSAAPEPDADVMYSYDAKKGPGAGSQILSQAINQAVERFENKETEDMVKKEYDVIDGYENEKEKEVAGYDADDDDFEVIEKDFA
ncbi:MAG: hypothetical protein Q9227_007748 [Pyrenula ochraceoflavens]